jgi:hypothetical protein
MQPRIAPGIDLKGAAQEHPAAEAAQCGCPPSKRGWRDSRRSLSLDKGKNGVAIDAVALSAGAEVSLEAGEIAGVGANCVSREVFGDGQPPNVLSACFVDPHSTS